MLAICTYSLDRCGATEVIEVVSNHQFALIKREGEGEIIESSDLKQSKEEIQSQAKFLSENPNPILRIAGDGSLLYINQAGVSLLPQWHLQAGQAAHPALQEAVFQSMNNGTTQVLDLECGEQVYSFHVAPIVAAGYANLYGRDITKRKRAEDTILRRNRELSVLYMISRATAQSLNLEETLNNALEATLEALDVEVGGICLLEPEGETLTLRVVRGLSDEVARNLQHVKLGEGISGRAIAEKRPIVLDVQDYPSQRLAPYIAQERLQSLASTPLLSAGQAVGAINLSTRRVRAFPPEELELLTAIGQQLGGVIQNAQLYEAVQRELAERERAEEALVQEQHLLSALIDNIPDHIYFKDTESRFTRINKATAEWLGLADPAQALGKTGFDFYSEDHARPAYEDEQRRKGDVV
jgi:PAS domain-containing protein